MSNELSAAKDATLRNPVETLPRILLADSEPYFLRGLRATIEEQGSFRVVDVATTGKEFLSLLSHHRPRLLLMGFRLACGRDALGLAPEFRRRCPDTAVMVFLPRNSALFTERLLIAGVRGILDRCSLPKDLLPAIRHVLGGEVFADPSFSATQPRPDSTAAQCDLFILTDREREIFHLLGMEKSYKDIATLLGISTKTVERHRENIKTKLRFRSAKALALAAKARVLWESSGVDYVI